MTPSQFFNQNSYYILPSLFTPQQCAHIASLFDAHWESKGRPALPGFGMAVHPLFDLIPDIAPYYAHPLLLDTLADILADQPRLVHTGARVSNQDSNALLGWHEHYGWDKSALSNRTRPERVLFGCYVRGSNPENGPLIVHPRKFNDPLTPCPVGAQENWPGQIAVNAPPGSVVIFDTALYHTAARGTHPGFRYLFGAHVQGASNTRPHGEDNITPTDTPALAAHKAANPRLKKFLNPL
jgi:hypothetical protein